MKSQRAPILLLAVAAIAIVNVSGEYRFASEKLRRANVAAVHGHGHGHGHGHEHGHDHEHELHERSFTTPLDHFNPRSDETVLMVRALTHAADL